MPGGEHRRKGSRNGGPARGARRPRGPSVPGSIALLLAVSQRRAGTRQQVFGRDLERPTRSRPRLMEESAPQAGRRDSRRATEGSGFGRRWRWQNAVPSGWRRTRRRQRHPSRREGGVLVGSRPLHHREEASRGGVATSTRDGSFKSPSQRVPGRAGRPRRRARG